MQTDVPEQVNEQLCQKELERMTDQFVRLTAEFDNFKKRAEKERVQWLKHTQTQVILDFLTVADNFDRALQAARTSEQAQELSSWISGFDLTYKELYKVLAKYDIEEIKDHELFDPQVHEAIVHIDSPEHISGSIVAVLEKGFTRKGELLRPAKVSVAK